MVTNPTQRAEAWLTQYDNATFPREIASLDEAASIIRDLLAERAWRPTHRHLKRGSEYQVLAFGELQTTSPIPDETPVTIYLAGNGAYFVRPTAEFEDGRFELIPEPPKP